MDKIAVIVPTYKTGLYVFKLLDALKLQTLSKNRYVVKIILNGPKEPYFSSISDYIAGNSLYELYYLKESGVSVARNFGLDISKVNKYIAFIDDDDYVSDNYLELLLNEMEDGAADIVQSNFKTDSGGLIGKDYISHAFMSVQRDKRSIYHYKKFLSSVCGKLYRTEVLQGVRFDDRLKIGEDAVFLFSVSRNLNRWSFSALECVYFRNIREGSASRSTRGIKAVFDDARQKIYGFSRVYFSSMLSYNFLLYVNRVAASIKVLILDIFNIVRAK